MKIYRNISEFIKPQYTVLTVGTFDGVHLGHQKILERLKAIAIEHGGNVVVLTFHPHPRTILFGRESGFEMLNTIPEKADLLSRMGVDHLVIQPFTLDFSRMEYDLFVKEMLVDGLGVKTLVIGYDHQFGHRRKGNMAELLQLAPQLGFEVEEIPEQDVDEIAVSSTRIRKALKAGEVETAALMLGYQYSLNGTVVQGRRIGRTLGYPTANIQVDDPDKLIPANGIYAVKVEIDNRIFNGALSIGNRPTFDNGERSIEVHILGFDEDIYGQPLRVVFHHFLRSEMKFHSAEALVEQMNADCRLCMQLLSD